MFYDGGDYEIIVRVNDFYLNNVSKIWKALVLTVPELLLHVPMSCRTG